MADANYARETFNRIKAASNATKREPTAPGAIAYTINRQNLEVTGSFSFPLVQTEDATTGGINLEVADFLIAPTPTPPPA